MEYESGMRRLCDGDIKKSSGRFNLFIISNFHKYRGTTVRSLVQKNDSYAATFDYKICTYSSRK